MKSKYTSLKSWNKLEKTFGKEARKIVKRHSGMKTTPEGYSVDGLYYLSMLALDVLSRRTKCKNYRRYKGLRAPKCLNGAGCMMCWEKYVDNNYL